jgi:hypothetical protein
MAWFLDRVKLGMPRARESDGCGFAFIGVDLIGLGHPVPEHLVWS